MKKNIIIVGMTESIMTSRGNRHPSLATYLVNKGYKLHYVSSNFYHSEKRWFTDIEIKNAQSKADYDLHILNKIGYKKNISAMRVLSNLAFSIKSYLFLKKHINTETILIIPSRPVELIYFASVLRKKYKISVLVDIQDIWPDMLVNKSGIATYVFTKYCNYFLKRSLKYIDKFIHVAPSFQDWLKRYSPTSSSKFVPLGFEEDRWEVINSTPNVSSKNKITFLVIAQLTFQFDIMPLLDALKNNNSFELVLVGEDGKGERYGELISFLKVHNVKNFKNHGYLNTVNLKKIMKTCDIGVVPMISTSIPNKVFDYIANDMPIYVLGQNDSSDFVKKYGIGWSTEFNTDGVKNFLNKINHKDIEDKRLKLTNIKNEFNRHNIHKKILNEIDS
jgi:hypothetical protein